MTAATIVVVVRRFALGHAASYEEIDASLQGRGGFYSYDVAAPTAGLPP